MANGENLSGGNQDWWNISNDQRFMQTGETNVDRFAREKAAIDPAAEEELAYYQNNPDKIASLVDDDPEKVKWYQDHPDQIGQLLAEYHSRTNSTSAGGAKQAAKDQVIDNAKQQVIDNAKKQAAEEAGQAGEDSGEADHATYEARGKKVNEVVIKKTTEVIGDPSAAPENPDIDNPDQVPNIIDTSEAEPRTRVDDFVDADISEMDDTEKANFYAQLAKFTPEERAEARKKLNAKLAALEAKKAELMGANPAEAEEADEPEESDTTEPDADELANQTVNQIAEELGVDSEKLESNPEAITEEEAKATLEKAKAKPTLKERLKRIVPRALVVALAAVAAVASFSGKVGNKKNAVDTYQSYDEYKNDQDNQNNPDISSVKAAEKSADTDDSSSAEKSVESSAYAGELPNGTTYDFSEYADYGNKVSHNAFGYDKSYIHGDRDKTVKAFEEMSAKGPEYLATYAYDILTDAEKQDLGIDGWSVTQLDNYMSNNENGGDLQKSIKAKLDQVLSDENDTRYEWYNENDTETTYYIYFVDENGDNIMTPEEVHVSQDTKKRNGAPQVDVYRMIDGNWVKVGDYNEACGLQGNYNTPVPGVPEINEPDYPDDTPDKDDDTTITENDDDTPTPEKDDDTPEKDDDSEKDDDTPEKDDDDTPTPEVDDDTPTPEVDDDTPTPEVDDDEGDKPKDAENLERIDNKINEDDAKDHGSNDINPGTTEDVTEVEEVTEKPTGEDYEGTEAETVQNEASESAEPVQETVSPENDYSENQGGANSGEYSPNQDNDSGQEEANNNVTPDADNPADTMNDLVNN